MRILELSNLDIGYEKSLIKNINLVAEQGELIAMIGLNGIGKSTLLKTIAGILPQKNGDLIVNNKKFEHYSKQNLASIIGFSTVNQISATNLTVKDVVALGRIPYTSIFGLLKKNDKEIIEYAIKECGLEKIKEKEITKISDGQRQRAFIARLIAQQTKILLFDEPTAFLDVEGKYKIVYLFKQIVRQMNKTIIFSTHDLKIAIQTADKIWLFIENEITDALPEDLVLKGWFEKLFSHSNINFNNFTADFNVNFKTIGEIKISNNSSELRKHWTIKALNKIGFSINNKSNQEIIIFDNYWQHKTLNNTITNFNSIYELLKHIKNGTKN